jgi:toxin ParE1/3/4
MARRDIDTAIDYYLAEGSPTAALGFVDALEEAITHIGNHPGAGSPRYGHELGLPGLRCWPVAPYPHLLFYLDRLDHVDLWRVLHGRRDLPETLAPDP